MPKFGDGLACQQDCTGYRLSNCDECILPGTNCGFSMNGIQCCPIGVHGAVTGKCENISDGMIIKQECG